MPNFSIEAQGEANPLSETTLLHTLQAASSSVPTQIQSGTKQLQQWERVSGFYQGLQSVFVSRELPVEVRYLAVIQIKNGIDKYWRKTAPNAVVSEEKAVIRSRLISSTLDEPDQRLALQSALVTAKIVRFEYPGDWPEAISTSLQAIRESIAHSSDSRLDRSLLILLHIIKELSTARIQRSRTNLQAATPEILSVVGQLYTAKTTQWQIRMQQGQNDAYLESAMSQSLLALRVLRRLIISGYDFPNRHSEVVDFWQFTLSQVQILHGVVFGTQSSHGGQGAITASKHLLQLSKFHLDVSDKHPSAFALLPSSLDLVRAYWTLTKRYSETYTQDLAASEVSRDGSDPEERSRSLEKLCLNGLRLIRACIRMAYKPANTFRFKQDQEKEERKLAENTMKHDLFTQSLVEELMTTAISKFLLLRQSDLDDWINDAEDWVNRQDNESEDMNLSIRACSERLVLDLCTHFKSNLTQPMLNLFQSVIADSNGDVFFKDAVYAAVGMAGPIFKDDIDFDRVLSSVLVPEAQNDKQGSNIIRRRISILVGQWVVIKIAAESRPVIYQLFDHLLDESQPANDEVVRVTAGQQFKNVVDDFDFDAKQFVPFAESLITRLMKLVEEVEQTATKMALLETISALIERFDFYIEPFSQRIVDMLPTLWEQSGEEHLMKQVILTILSRLVQALKDKSAGMHEMLIPIIQNAVQSDSDMQVYLLEEALHLWHSILVQSKTPISSSFLSLVEHILPFFERASEALREALEITESYILLAPSDMLVESTRKVFMVKLTDLIGPKVKAESNGMVCNLVELLIRSAENLGGEAAVKQVIFELMETGLLSKLMGGLRSAWVAHCTTGPLAKVPAVDGLVETDYFSIFSRLVLCSSELFIEVVAYIQVEQDSPTEARLDPAQNIKWLLEEWFSHFENVGDPSKRKLFCLALTRLLETGRPAVLSNLQLLMSMWTDVITELCEQHSGEADDSGNYTSTLDLAKDSLVYEDIRGLTVAAEDGAPEEPEQERRRVLTFHDPVHRINLPSFVKEKLGQGIARTGGEAQFRDEWLVNVDADVINAFGRLGIM